MPSTVEKSEASSVGSTIYVGFILPKEVLTAIMDVGNSCIEVAFKTKNNAEAYSGYSERSRRFATLIPYGVAAPEMPSKLTDKFMQTADKVSSSSVLKSFFAIGFKNLERAFETPLSSQTCISPIHTA